MSFQVTPTPTPTSQSTPALYGLTLAGKAILHPSTAHVRRGLDQPTFRFAADWARASRKNERAARHETKRLVYKLKVLGQPVTDEVRSKTQSGENTFTAKTRFTISFY